MMHEHRTDGGAIPSTAGRPWWGANEVLAFVLELVALGCLFAWGYGLGDGMAVQLLLGLVVLALAIAVWGLFCAPRARFRLPLAGVLAFKALVLGGSAVALYSMGHTVAGVVLGAVVVVNTSLTETFRRRPPAGG
ncbi:YrdB family protein [Streptomyces laculatispora]|uniref:YrdB family protein n=1 Tax=Streptomyces laculatispora TaxID=887464 RepID=A0ABY9I4E3_9ACTN|nr:YrdB family protein [Streptomyces laculatispora]WLQ41038.1 YrdB family protein [Streptomyces laculatispora]